MTGVAAPRPGGIVCPLVTPLTAEGRLDEDVLRGLIEALVPTLDGLFVLGSSGELTWLPDEIALSVSRTSPWTMSAGGSRSMSGSGTRA